MKLFHHVRNNAVAYVALFVALGGTALAASALPKNSVGTAQLQNGAVTGQKVAHHTLTGTNIKSSTLGTVPNAAHLGGFTAATFQHAIRGKCARGQAIQAVLRGGNVICRAIGAISGVTAGTGLTGGGTSGNVVLSIDPSVVQARVSGVCAGRGAVSSIKQDGTVNCHTTNEVQMMGGTGAATLGTTADFMAPVGISTPTNQEQTVLIGSANAPSAARHLFVRVASAPPTGGSWTFMFYVNGKPEKAMTCVITAPADSCHATGSVSIPRGARIALHEAATNITAGTTATYGWTNNTF